MSGRFRRPLEVPFCQVPRQLAQDTNLSLEAIGLMTYLLSKPLDWQPRIADVEKQWKIGRERRQRIYGELERAGYFQRIKTKNHETGQWIHDIVIHTEPLPPGERTEVSGRVKPRRISSKSPGTGKPSPVQPSTAQPSPGNPSVYSKTDSQNIDSHIKEREQTECEASPQAHTRPRSSASQRKKKGSAKEEMANTLRANPIAKAIRFVCDLPPFADCSAGTLKQVELLAKRIVDDGGNHRSVINLYDWKRHKKHEYGAMHFPLAWALADWGGFVVEVSGDNELMTRVWNDTGSTNYNG